MPRVRGLQDCFAVYKLGLCQSRRDVIARSGFCNEAISELVGDRFALFAMTQQHGFDKSWKWHHLYPGVGFEIVGPCLVSIIELYITDLTAKQDGLFCDGTVNHRMAR